MKNAEKTLSLEVYENTIDLKFNEKGQYYTEWGIDIDALEYNAGLSDQYYTTGDGYYRAYCDKSACTDLADVIKNILIARINEELEYMGINAEPSEEFWVYSQE